MQARRALKGATSFIGRSCKFLGASRRTLRRCGHPLDHEPQEGSRPFCGNKLKVLRRVASLVTVHSEPRGTVRFANLATNTITVDRGHS